MDACLEFKFDPKSDLDYSQKHLMAQVHYKRMNLNHFLVLNFHLTMQLLIQNLSIQFLILKFT